MKILIIDNAAISYKDDRYFVYKTTGEFGKELKDLGHEVEYFQLCRNTSSSLSDYDLEEQGIHVTASKLYMSKMLTYFVAYLKGIQRIFKADFIYIYYPNSFSFLGFFAWLIGKKYGLYIRGEAGIYSEKSNFLYKNAIVVFTVSHAFTDAVNSQFSVAKAFTIKPMISFSDQDVVLGRDYSKVDNFSVLFLGRIDREKGLFELLEAIALLKIKTDYRFHLNIIGGGTYLEDLKETAARFDIVNNVNFKGPVGNLDEIRDAYLQSDIYILPTYHEGFPRTLYEAMIFGTPIITTFVGGIPALMKDGGNCLKIEAKSVGSIVEKLMFAFNNYYLMKRLAENGIETVREIVKQGRPSHAEHLHKIINME